MDKIGALLLATILLGCSVAHTHAQDIAGIEDCTKTSGLDKRTGCFQSNIDFLNRQAAKTSADLQQKLAAANAEIGELKRTVATLQKNVTALQTTVAALQTNLTNLQTSVEQLQKNAKKPDLK
jgi:septal ring factor EnvC (AmiA/AmiB activator)